MSTPNLGILYSFLGTISLAQAVRTRLRLQQYRQRSS